LEKAVIFNIMRYSIHDGPGIRTTVFFKGCPLSCKWCHNPESLSAEPQSVFNPRKCIKCGRCEVNEICPTGARETIGYGIALPELMEEINKDRLFYEQSGGGVTFSGGEPLFQADFLLEALTRCNEDYINSAVDTSGFCGTETIVRAAEMADYFLYDIKFMDSEKHEKYCGAPNDLVLKNLKRLADTKTKLLLRIPVIPSINDDTREMRAIYDFIREFKNIAAVHLLPYHNIQAGKYERIGKEYELSGIPGNESPNMDDIKKIFNNRFMTKVGG
jgi:pyruvate formate lyase activating enzyme